MTKRQIKRKARRQARSFGLFEIIVVLVLVVVSVMIWKGPKQPDINIPQISIPTVVVQVPSSVTNLPRQLVGDLDIESIVNIHRGDGSQSNSEITDDNSTQDIECWVMTEAVGGEPAIGIKGTSDANGECIIN